jgi:stalled ribosome alternative rescue factor ArfA
MEASMRKNVIAKELGNRKYRQRIVEAKKGKGSYKRNTIKLAKFFLIIKEKSDA